jgi:DNA mismatch repair ATPase MutL
MGSSKLNKEQIFFFLNKRPIDMPRKFKQLFIDTYKQYNTSINPIIILNIDVEDNNYDINVSPDKREIFLKNEEEVIDNLKIKINEFFENIQRTKAYDHHSVISHSKLNNSVQSNKLPFVPSSESNWKSKKRPFSEIS